MLEWTRTSAKDPGIENEEEDEDESETHPVVGKTIYQSVRKNQFEI